MGPRSGHLQGVLAATVALFGSADAERWTTVSQTQACASGSCNAFALSVMIMNRGLPAYEDLSTCRALCEGTTGCVAINWFADSSWCQLLSSTCQLHADCATHQNPSYHELTATFPVTPAPPTGGWSVVSDVYSCQTGPCESHFQTYGIGGGTLHADVGGCRQRCENTANCKAINWYEQTTFCQLMTAHGCPVHGGQCKTGDRPSYHELTVPPTDAPSPAPTRSPTDVNGRSRKAGVGCNSYNRAECCGRVDGRSGDFDGQSCIPAIPGQLFNGDWECEPEHWLMNTLQWDTMGTCPPPGTAAPTDPEGRSRLPEPVGCNKILERTVCCDHLDGRPAFLNVKCVPANTGQTFNGGAVCEPLSHIQGSNQLATMASCPYTAAVPTTSPTDVNGRSRIPGFGCNGYSRAECCGRVDGRGGSFHAQSCIPAAPGQLFGNWECEPEHWVMSTNQWDKMGTCPPPGTAAPTDVDGRIRLPEPVACGHIPDRTRCCNYLDGRAEWLDQKCVPSLPGMLFDYGNLCSVQAYVMGNPALKAKMGPCPDTATDSPSIAPSRATDAPSRATDAPSRATDAPSRATGTPSRATGTPSRATGTPNTGGICSTGIQSEAFPSICCADSCGTCGGRGCGQRPGGSANCCNSEIRESGRICSSSVAPPCVYATPAPTTTPATCCAVLNTRGRLFTKRKVQQNAPTLLWRGDGPSARRAAGLTHDAELELYLPPGSTSSGGYLYEADFYMFAEPELGRPEHCLGSGLNVTVTCIGTPHCAVYVFVYHQPPFSANTNGGFPQLANTPGWQARGRCSPRFGNDTGTCPMLGLRYNLMENEDVDIEQAPGTDLQYFLIAVVARKNCNDNTLSNATQCTAVPSTDIATTCVWNSNTGMCEEDWCPPRLATGGGSTGGGSTSGVSTSGVSTGVGSTGGGPAQCPVDLDCSGA